MTQELDLLQLEITFGEFGIKVMISQSFEYYVQVHCMFIFIFRCFQNIDIVSVSISKVTIFIMFLIKKMRKRKQF
jgi:ABC-type sulfate transport system permease component